MKAKTKAEIVADAKQLLSEIKQIFADADHWNRYVRKPDEPSLDPDPDGGLRKRESVLESFIEANK